MSSVTRANMLNIQINKVFSEIIDESLKYWAKNSKGFITDMGYKDLFVITDRWESQIRRINRDLNSLEHGARLGFSQAKGMHGFNAHRTRQSATDKLKVINAVQDNAGRALNAVLDLIAAIRRPTDREWIEGLKKLIDNAEGFHGNLHKIEATVKQHDHVLYQAVGSGFREIRELQPPPAATGSIFKILILLLLFIPAMRKLGGSEKS
ncbi:hypothetical protein BTA51_06720 [Hahella sp. CCB-MM4]|uniref:hypothetical protein n=1 Tax=Hahella sp. (strain CCB-MM4) TaxID=1926491 RepID=UPI000B9C3A79|nr:hypothetical protein [Hahella sp. CCB-MM4]OZG74670.1 hypothetical protein BTA51_06720 [Hahella sp. CCB-MM4]